MPDIKKTNSGIHIEDPLVITRLADTLGQHLEQVNPGWIKPCIVVCIGTDRSTGDCLGPLVGSRLQDFQSPLFAVYGTLDDPVHAKNLESKLQEINQQYPQAFILAIDACLGRLESVGQILIRQGPLLPGAAVQKQLPPVGDLSISGIVNVGGYLEYMVLQNTRLNLVMKMAQRITHSLYYAIRQMSTPVTPLKEIAYFDNALSNL